MRPQQADPASGSPPLIALIEIPQVCSLKFPT
jgi:hypothetical protein